VRELLEGDGPLPDAIFAFNDALAVGALRALDASGVRVPEDVAVAGIDAIQESAYTHPPLTSIAPDLDVIAERALTLLEEQMQRPAGLEEGAPSQEPRTVSATVPHEATPFRLVVRESSCRRPAAP
jgi:DNA-binding LacI/PurR family transcriptional regulator